MADNLSMDGQPVIIGRKPTGGTNEPVVPIGLINPNNHQDAADYGRILSQTPQSTVSENKNSQLKQEQSKEADGDDSLLTNTIDDNWLLNEVIINDDEEIDTGYGDVDEDPFIAVDYGMPQENEILTMIKDYVFNDELIEKLAKILGVTTEDVRPMLDIAITSISMQLPNLIGNNEKVGPLYEAVSESNVMDMAKPFMGHIVKMLFGSDENPNYEAGSESNVEDILKDIAANLDETSQEVEEVVVQPEPQPQPKGSDPLGESLGNVLSEGEVEDSWNKEVWGKKKKDAEEIEAEIPDDIFS